MLDGPLSPTGIVCASDTQAAGVLEAAAPLGLSVPGDLSRSPATTTSSSPTTSDSRPIHQPLFESGVRAVERLLVGIDGAPMGPLREVQDISLVVRRSTAPAAT